MDHQYYKDYYHLERNHWFFLARNNILMTYLQSLLAEEERELRILNVGVATGQTTELLSKFGRVTSIEYDEECFTFVKEILPNYEVLQGSITNLPFESASFDLVCAFDVIEHVEDDQMAVSELMRVCAPRGYVFVTVPAFQFMWGKHDEINMHKRRYVRSQLSELFFEGSGEVVHSTYFNFWLFPLIAIARLASRVFESRASKRSDFAMSGGGKETIFYKVFNSESKLIGRMRFPVGVSLLISWRKAQSA